MDVWRKYTISHQITYLTPPSRGVVIPSLVFTIPVILALAALVITIFLQRNITAELQTIADIAAKAGAAASCSTKDCFRESRIIPLNLIEKHFLQTDGTLDRDEGNFRWNVGDNSIEIERGVFLPNGSFQSFEQDWQVANPGMPAFAAYNAVRVRIERNQILSILPSFLPGSLSSNVTATAVAKPPATGERVPPFAIPICSLLNNQGDFDKSTVCDADRIFTESNRYCPANNPNCDIVPDFNFSLFTPPVEGLSRIYGNDSNVQIQEIDSHPGIVGCSYFSQRYSRTDQNFGVVGMAIGNDPSIQATTSAIQDILNNVDGKQPNVAIGDTFSILDEGLTTAEAGERVEILQDSLLGNQSEYVPLTSEERHTISFYNLSFMGLFGRGGCDDTHVTGVARRATVGVCQSTRNAWGRWDRYLELVGTSGASNNRGVNNPKKIWRVRIPVIAETGSEARPCLGMLGNSTNIPNPATRSSASTYQIIGFVTSYIFDSDIGNGAATLPDVSCGNDPNRERIRNTTMIGGYSCSIGEAVVEDATHPFGFRPNPSEPPRSCNMVRSRLDCNTSLFPSAEDRFVNQPYLVN